MSETVVTCFPSPFIQDYCPTILSPFPPSLTWPGSQSNDWRIRCSPFIPINATCVFEPPPDGFCNSDLTHLVSCASCICEQVGVIELFIVTRLFERKTSLKFNRSEKQRLRRNTSLKTVKRFKCLSSSVLVQAS